MHYIYKTHDTCSTQIEFDLDGKIVTNVKFTGGCNGNLQAIPLLVDGWNAEDVIAKVGNVKCGKRPTSCAGQLAEALSTALAEAQQPFKVVS